MATIQTSDQAALSPTGAAPGWLDRIDPRARIVGAALFAVVVVACTQIAVLTLALALSVALLVASGLPVRRTLKRMAAMDGFILFMLVLLPFSVPGDPLFTVFGFTASWQGLLRAVEIALTANAVVLALLVLVGTMEPVNLGHALHALRTPERLVHLLMFSIRYIGTLREEYVRLRTAMKMRGFKPGTNWHTYRSYGYLVGMMLVRAVERSERILSAMKCRGFSGRLVMVHRFALSGSDLAFGAVLLTAMALLILLDVSPWL